MPHNNRSDIEKRPVKRIFVVGCERSGTTLIQSIIAGHPGFASFPESRFFQEINYATRWKRYGVHAGLTLLPRFVVGQILNGLGIACPRIKARIPAFYKECGWPYDLSDKELSPVYKRDLYPILVSILDRHAGSEGWIEKTPVHIFYVDQIEKYVPDALFIHVVRKGEETIASIEDAFQRYNLWKRMYTKNRKKRINMFITQWNRANSMSAGHAPKPNHQIIRYEDFIEAPDDELRKITDFLDIPYDKKLLDFDASAYITSYERHKMTMGQKIKKPESKFARLFTPDEQAYIKRRLKDRLTRREP